MTTPPPPAGPPPYPPNAGFPMVPPPPPAQPVRRRRAVLIGVVAGVAFALLASAGVAWWLMREEGALAGGPRVTDKTAGVSYGVPEGWKQKKGELISPFTSTIVKKSTDDDGGSTVIAGRGDAIPESDLKERTEFAARSNAEFFYPNGSSVLKESEPTTVSGRAAHTATSVVNDGEGGKVYLRIMVVSVDDSHSVFMLGVAQPLGAPEEADVEAVLSSISFE